MREDRKPPAIENVPGLRWLEREHGFAAVWRARPDLVKRGYTPKNVRLWAPSKERPEPSAADLLSITDRANHHQTQMLVWGRGGTPQVTMHDGTVGSLIFNYKTDRISPYRKKIRHCTRVYYDNLMKRLEKDIGHEPISEIRAKHVMRWHDEWIENEGGADKVSLGHALVGMLRTLTNFGAGMLEDEECERLSGILRRLKFAQGKPRSERLTINQINAIRVKAHEMGHPSIALAQAFQWVAMLRQKDVIGEWVPMKEPGVSGVTFKDKKWLRGIRWEAINNDLILRHITSKRQKEIVVDLRLDPMILEELGYFKDIPASGPCIICEATGRPWTADEFRRAWRKVATAAGVPKAVKNMDSRAGAITEATEAGANLEHVQHAATHSDISMTQRYSRGGEEKTAEVMRIRVASRQNNKRTP